MFLSRQEAILLIVKLEHAPIQIRRYLALWLQELDGELYVGRVSPSTRQGLWQKIIAGLSGGKALMLWQADNEQGYELAVHGHPQGYLIQLQNQWFTGIPQ